MLVQLVLPLLSMLEIILELLLIIMPQLELWELVMPMLPGILVRLVLLEML